MYHAALKKMLIFACLGAIIGFLIGLSNWDGIIGMLILFTWTGAGAPSGWITLEKIFGKHFFIGNPLLVLLAYCFRIGFSFAVGIFALPIRLIYYSIKSRQEV